MFKRLSPHLRAVLVALFVTFLWATSWILIKLGLGDIPALTFAGLRYTLAFLVLLPFAARSGKLAPLRALPARRWGQLVALGLVYYTLTQGTGFLAISFLPAATFSLILNFSAVVVAVIGIFTLREMPSVLQWVGVLIFIAGILVYFYPVNLPAGQLVGLVIGLISMLATSVASVMGRATNRQMDLDALAVTVVSMGVGALVLLVVGIITQGLPPLNLTHWLLIVWLAVVNSALAFTLWNHTLRTLSATESSIINNTMLIQIAALAWLFLGEALDARQIAGLAVSAIGTLVVQVKWGRKFDEAKHASA